MADHNQLREQAHAAIAGLPRPVENDAVLSAVKPILPAKEYGEFEKWLKSAGQIYLRKLNG